MSLLSAGPSHCYSVVSVLVGLLMIVPTSDRITMVVVRILGLPEGRQLSLETLFQTAV
jgi:hypothetical protein